MRRDSDAVGVAIERLEWSDPVDRHSPDVLRNRAVAGAHRASLIGLTALPLDRDSQITQVMTWLALLARLPTTEPSAYWPSVGLSRARLRWWSQVVLVDADGHQLTDPVTIPRPLPGRMHMGPVTVYDTAAVAALPGSACAVGIAQLDHWLPAPVAGLYLPALLLLLWMAAGQYYGAHRVKQNRETLRLAPALPAITGSVDGSPAQAKPAAEHAAETSPTAARLWGQALRQHNTVREEFAAYETDPTQYFYRPLLADHSHPAIQAFYEALAAADALRLDDHTPDDLTYVRDYADRVASAARAWTTADTLARSTGDSEFTAEQRKLMRTAQRLVNLALDDSASHNERTTAYERVLDLFTNAGLTPSKSIASALQHQISAAHRPLLPTQSTTDR